MSKLAGKCGFIFLAGKNHPGTVGYEDGVKGCVSPVCYVEVSPLIHVFDFTSRSGVEGCDGLHTVYQFG